MSRASNETRAAKAGRLAGAVDGFLGKDDARSRFMHERRSLDESEWPSFRDAYNAEVSAVSGVRAVRS